MIQLPIVVNMSVDQSKRVYCLAVEQTCETYCLCTDAVYNVNIIDAPRYEGDYIITPLAAEAIILQTRDKVCEDDITVLKIPTHETHNEYGVTFYIAEA